MVTTNPETTPDSIEWVPLAAIRTDHRVNTRTFDPNWVEKKLREGFDPNKVGVPIVSDRGDETYVWIDGQNRGELMRRAGWSDQKIQCRAFRGLTRAEEAELFLGHNDNRQVKPLAKFLARVTAGNTDAVAINRIAKKLGWKIEERNSSKSITAVVSLDKVYQSDKQADGSPGPALELTLRVVTEAWGYKSEAVDGRIIAGIGAVFNRFGDSVDLAVLVKKLAEYPAGPSGVLGKARGMQQFQGGTVGHCVAEVVVTAYNARRRTNVLPDWR
ncbi:DUF6551 family protein [Streptomyces sp. NPDC002853]